MGAAENRNKSQAMAAHLVAMGYWHGRRATSGLTNIPVDEPGSAAYRRLLAKQQNRAYNAKGKSL